MKINGIGKQKLGDWSMTFSEYVIECLQHNGDSTVKQIWEYLSPAGRKDMTRLDVQLALELMEKDGLLVRVQRHWRMKVWTV